MVKSEILSDVRITLNITIIRHFSGCYLDVFLSGFLRLVLGLVLVNLVRLVLYRENQTKITVCWQTGCAMGKGLVIKYKKFADIKSDLSSY